MCYYQTCVNLEYSDYRGKRGGRCKRTHIRSNLISLGSTCEIRGPNESTYVNGYTNHSIQNQQVKRRSSILIRPAFTRNEKPDTFKQPVDHNVTKQNKMIPKNQPPSIYVLNAQAITKPHAIDQLRTEITSLNVDVAIITETHFFFF